MKWKLPKLTKFFTAWSYSRLSDWRLCPAQAAYKHLHKLPSPDNPASARGQAYHRVGEVYLKTGGKVPKEFSGKFTEPLKKLRAMKAIAEVSWTFTNQWIATQWNDWTGAWVRMKVDAHVLVPSLNVVDLVDYKTGRIKPEQHEEQGKLYAPAGLLSYPNAKAVRVRFWYLDHNLMSPTMTYTRKQLPELQRYWEKEAEPMLADRRFPTRPGGYCSWCPYSKTKGGPCQY